MSDAHTFTVRYDEAALQTVLRAFLIHQWGGLRLLAALALVVVGFAAHLIVFGFDGWFAGFISALALVIFVMGGLTWIVYRRRMLAKVRRLKTPVLTFTLSEDRIANDSGSMTLVWSAIKEILDCGSCWLLVLEGHQFVTLPVEGIGAEALAFLRGKVGKFSMIARRR